MWVDDYFHYSDWEKSMNETYDSFNLMIPPVKKNETKYFFNRGTQQRITPKGIFPPANSKRQILEPVVNEFKIAEAQRETTGLNEHAEFNRDPYKAMINKELVRSAGLQPLTDNLTFRTNLTNLKQGLK